MKKNHKIIFIIGLLIVLSMAFLSCKHFLPEKSAPIATGQTIILEQEKSTSVIDVQAITVDSPICLYSHKDKNDLKPISVSQNLIGEIKDSQLIKVEKSSTIQLHRIDFSGVYDLEGRKFKSVILDGIETKYFSITENGNLDVWHAKLNSIVQVIAIEN
jgi:hypothetical protein